MNKFRTGLTSVTFRNKTVDEIIKIAGEAELDGIEWGGDVHVPPGHIEIAAETARKTMEAGLEVFSYGSYYHGDDSEDFDAVLNSAVTLGAPVIRIWAGRKSYEESSDGEIERLAKRIGECCRKARDFNIKIGLEYHRHTLTQTKSGALMFLGNVAEDNLYCYWQPNPEIDILEQISEIDLLQSKILNIHVFSWTGKADRHLLVSGADRWRKYIDHIVKSPGKHNLILEFVVDDKDEAFFKDAETLRELSAYANNLT